MRFRARIALLLFLSACAASTHPPDTSGTRSQRRTNLERAAKLPWADDGRCVVREASQPWPVLVERCYRTLDHDRIEFRDTTGRCAVASTAAAAMGVGLCILAAPEIAVGAVIVLGVVVVGFVLEEALEAYELRHTYPEEAGTSRETKTSFREAEPQRRPKPEPSGQDLQPPVPPEPGERERRPDCKPVPVPRASKDGPHNECADQIPPNRYPGMDVRVGGIRFDALQVGVRALWEIKTHRFDEYSSFIQRMELQKELKQINKERDTAVACGYDFIIGVSTQEHREALLEADFSLNVVVTGCKR